MKFHYLQPYQFILFLMFDLTPFKGDAGTNDVMQDADEQAKWIKDFPPSQPLQLEKILDSKVVKKIRKKICTNYLVKWKGLPDIDAKWMSE